MWCSQVLSPEGQQMRNGSTRVDDSTKETVLTGLIIMVSREKRDDLVFFVFQNFASQLQLREVIDTLLWRLMLSNEFP